MRYVNKFFDTYMCIKDVQSNEHQALEIEQPYLVAAVEGQDLKTKPKA